MVSYARRWALSRNPYFTNFDNDCMNFVSQALNAGGWAMVTSGQSAGPERKNNLANWFFIRTDTPPEYLPYNDYSRTWSISHDFFWFATEHSRRTTLLTYFEELLPSDVIEADWDPAQPDGFLDHAMMVTARAGDTVNDIYISQHSNDRLDFPLSEVLALEPLEQANYYGLRT